MGTPNGFPTPSPDGALAFYLGGCPALLLYKNGGPGVPYPYIFLFYVINIKRKRDGGPFAHAPLGVLCPFGGPLPLWGSFAPLGVLGSPTLI